MGFDNDTERQHFISQAEQRLNATNPMADPDNQAIYQFRLVDREAGTLRFQAKRKISGNLMIQDLFSFDRASRSSMRANFEPLFQEYEKTIHLNTQAVLRRITEGDYGVGGEVAGLLRSKLLNLFRNPFSVKLILELMPGFVENMHPTDPGRYRDYLRVLRGNKPQKRHICQELGITEEEYEEWLRILFLILDPLIDGQSSLYDQMVSSLRGNRETFLMVTVFTYSDKTCLLSDKGIVLQVQDDIHGAWSFNLSSNAFITYSFSNISEFYQNYRGPKPQIPNSGMNHLKDVLKDVAYVVHVHDDLDFLAKYNQQALYQCHGNVYNSKKTCHGVRMIT